MADPSNVRDFLAELEADITELERTKQTLEQDCISLESKKQYLAGSVTRAKKLMKEREAKDNEQMAIRTALLKSIEDDIHEAQKDLDALIAKEQVVEADLAVMLRTTDEEVEKFNEQLKAKKAELEALKAEKLTLLDELTDVKSDILAHSQNISALGTEFTQAQLEHEQLMQQLEALADEKRHEVQQLKQQVDSVFADYQEVCDKVVTEQRLLAEQRQKHQEFLDYETRANKALKAREVALLEQERQLEVRIVTSRRRDGVLDNLD